MGALRISSDDTPQTIMVYLKDIKVLPDLLQTRAETNLKIVSIYSKRMKSTDFEPILLYRLPDGRLVVADGFHRIAAARMLRREKIASTIVEGTMEEAILAGLAANKALEDRTLTNEDKAHAVNVMLRNKEFNSWSDNGISEQCSVASITVCRLRLRMRDDEGIAMPANIQIIKDGRPTGSWRKYRQPRNAPPTISVRAVGCSTIRDNGRQKPVPRDPEKAAQEVAQIMASRRSWQAILSNAEKFRSRLTSLNINATGVAKVQFFLGGTIVGDAAVVPFDGGDLDPFLAAAFRCLGARDALGLNRAIVVGYIGSVPVIKRAIKVFAHLIPGKPLEVMTPEEFVAEFAPRSETSDAVEILQRRFVDGDPEMAAMVEEERRSEFAPKPGESDLSPGDQ